MVDDLAPGSDPLAYMVADGASLAAAIVPALVAPFDEGVPGLRTLRSLGAI